MIRYRVFDLPVVGMGAFTPLPAHDPLSSSYGLVRVAGSPGTLPQPVPAPTRVWAPPISADPKTQSSNVSPDLLLWDKYIPYADNMGPARDAGVGMAFRRHAPLPVPARNWSITPRPAMLTRRTGGRRVMSWPRAFQRWPTMTSGGNG